MLKPGLDWAEDWIVVRYVDASKVKVTAIRFSEIERIEFDSKLSSGKLKRTQELTLRDGSTYTLTDDAVLVIGPDAYVRLVAMVAENIPI